jgi:Spy/CpxP family protein refolding chaperone
MTKFNLTTCSLTIVCATLLCGQTPPEPRTPPTPEQFAERQVTHVTEILSLNTTQQAEAKTIFTNEATASASVRGSMTTARKALQTAVEANDMAAIAAAATQIGTLTTQEVQTRAIADAALYAILTAEQQTTFKGFLSRGPGHGPGGPGMLPPGD